MSLKDIAYKKITLAEFETLHAEIERLHREGQLMAEGFSRSSQEIERLTNAVAIAGEEIDAHIEEIKRLQYEIGGHLKAWDIQREEIERLTAALQEIAAYPHGEEGGEIARRAIAYMRALTSSKDKPPGTFGGGGFGQ